MKQLQKDVIQWARDKKGRQLLKCVSEMGEIADALLKDDKENIKEEIGDVLVTMKLFAGLHGWTLDECLQKAYDKIKNRKGKTENGTFIKSGS